MLEAPLTLVRSTSPVTRREDLPVTRRLERGVRLHVFRSARFTTSFARVALHKDLADEITNTAVLAPVLRAATAAHPTREALAQRLADLYGASLSVAAEKLGDRGLLSASLEWPSAGLPGTGRLLGDALGLLREVLTQPKREPSGLLDPLLVATEQVNQRRALAAVRDDKGRYALRRAVQAACADEPYGLDVLGREEDLEGATPTALTALHARLLARAPVEIFVAADLTPDQAERAVRRYLLWPGRAPSPAPLAPAGSVRHARARPLSLVEREPVAQGKLVLVYRAPVAADDALAPAARTLAGVLGGGPYARLFKVVRETHGLCYYAHASWIDAKGLLIVNLGIEPKNEARVRRLVTQLLAEVASGQLEATALHGFRQALAHRVASLVDSRGAAVGFAQECLALGLNPSPTRLLARLRHVTPAHVRQVGSRLALDTSFFLGSTRRGASVPGGAR